MATTALPVAIVVSLYLRVVMFMLGIAGLVLAVVHTSWVLMIFTPIFLFHVAGVVNIALSCVSQGWVLLIIITIDYYAFWLSFCTGFLTLYLYWPTYDDAAYACAILHCIAAGLVAAVIVCDIIELHAHKDLGAAFVRSPRKCTLMSANPFRPHSILHAQRCKHKVRSQEFELQETLKGNIAY